MLRRAFSSSLVISCCIDSFVSAESVCSKFLIGKRISSSISSAVMVLWLLMSSIEFIVPPVYLSWVYFAENCLNNTVLCDNFCRTGWPIL